MVDFRKAANKIPKKTDMQEVFDEYRQVAESLDVEALLIELGVDYNDGDPEEWIASCPLPTHGGVDANPSFSVNPEKKLYNCFSCGGGSMLSLVKEIECVDWREALGTIKMFSDFGSASNFSDAISKALEKEREPFPSRHFEMPFYSTRLISNTVYSEHVAARFISEETAERLRIGWRPDHRYRDFVGPAIVVPHFWSGDLVGWQARWTVDERPKDVGKTINTHDLPKGHTLYNYDSALETDLPVVVVESPLTAARVASATSDFVPVATFGASVSVEQLRLLRRFDVVILAFDNDTAGDTATKRSVQLLDDFVSIKLTELVPGKGSDLGDVPDDAEVRRILEGATSY